ncbi:hypothetical protein CW713_06190 [Methanophagales archaeon]|nr:MAG: hypothetical protein CW713_06190 [Methanophagales archaeon]
MKASAYPKGVRTVLNIPESKRIAVGIGIGYPDWEHPLNSLRTERKPVEKSVTWRGMAEEGEKQWKDLKRRNKNEYPTNQNKISTSERYVIHGVCT